MHHYYGRQRLFGQGQPYYPNFPYTGRPNYQGYFQQNPAIFQFPYFQGQPNPWFGQGQMNKFPNSPFPIPYPQPQFPQQNSGFQSILDQFKNKDGTMDINKMLDTAGQMMGAFNQVSSIVKGLSSAFKV